MNVKNFPGLILVAAALLIGGPAFADDHRADARGGNGGRGASYAGGGTHVSRGSAYGSGRGSGTPGFAYGGRSYGGRGYGGGGRYAFSSHAGWSRGRVYGWNGRHYGWYNDGWYVIDPYPYYGGYPYYGYGYDAPAYTVYGSSDDDDSGGSVGAQVQRELARDGYYHGPIDGIVGPGTRAAISAYQRDNGLHVTGTINSHLLDSLDVN